MSRNYLQVSEVITFLRVNKFAVEDIVELLNRDDPEEPYYAWSGLETAKLNLYYISFQGIRFWYEETKL